MIEFTDESMEANKYSLENPPGDKWVLIRSGQAPSDIHRGSKIPKEWKDDTGHIFVNVDSTNQWLGYDRKNRIFVEPTMQWQSYAENVWARHHDTRTLIEDNLKKKDARSN